MVGESRRKVNTRRGTTPIGRFLLLLGLGFLVLAGLLVVALISRGNTRPGPLVTARGDLNQLTGNVTVPAGTTYHNVTAGEGNITVSTGATVEGDVTAQ